MPLEHYSTPLKRLFTKFVALSLSIQIARLTRHIVATLLVFGINRSTPTAPPAPAVALKRKVARIVATASLNLRAAAAVLTVLGTFGGVKLVVKGGTNRQTIVVGMHEIGFGIDEGY